jgi:hypothetical protein
MTTAIQSAEPTVNTKYAIVSGSDREMFPSIQADIYQPRSESEEIFIGLAEKSFDLLGEPGQKSLDVKVKQVRLGKDDTAFFALPKDARVTLLGCPRVFLVNKNTGEYSNLIKGMKLRGSDWVTVARMFVLLIGKDGEFVVDGEGKPQVFTVLLKSTRSDLVGNYRDPAPGTIVALNNALTKKYKARGSLLHLVSMNLLAVPTEAKSSVTNASKLTIKFKFGAGYKDLPEHMQEQAFKIATDKDLMAIMADPFRVNGAVAKVRSDVPELPGAIAEEYDEDAIPF